MKKLRQAIRARQKADPEFTGTPYAIAVLTGKRVGHRQIENLIYGRTKPWEVKVRTMQSLTKVFYDDGLRLKDFFEPKVA